MPGGRRTNYHVVPNGREWLVQREDRTASMGFSDKEEAIGEARRLAREGHGSLYVHGLDGRVQDEWTYGADPHPPQG